MTAATERAAVLFDILSEGDATSADILARTEWSYPLFMKAVQALRDICAASVDVISVTAEPKGPGPWVYGLKSGGAIIDPEQSRWVILRLQDSERRLKTIQHVLDVAVVTLDGRTTEGRKAKIYQLHIKRALEEVAMLDGQSPLL